MTSSSWFAVVDIVHLVPGRVRLRYRDRADGPVDAKNLQRIAATLDGVLRARANPAARSLVLTFDPSRTQAETLRAAIMALEPPQSGKTAESALDDRSKVAATFASLVASPFLPGRITLPLTLASAMPLFRQAVVDYARNDYVGGRITSHVLEAIAVSISVGRGDYLTANATTFMLALGDYLENSIARRSDDLLKTLLRPSSDKVWVLHGEQEVQVPSSAVAVGDTVIVATGAVIPVDGAVLNGEATVNEAAMTGESVSAVKSRGSNVLSGTLVEDGRLVIYAERVGQQTAAARIAEYVEQALQIKSETQLEATRLADRLVPMVLKLAGLTWILSGQWQRAAAVLQGDYSCALKLATPVAFKSAMYSAAHSGILVKGARALEGLAEADTFVFDKTGTLTTGSLEVTDVITFDASFSRHDLIGLAASIEEHYFHPVALAIVKAAKTASTRHFDHQEVEFIVAHGVASTIDGKRIVVGSRHFVEEDEGVPVADHRRTINRLYREGKTLLFIGFDGRLLGILGLKDGVRENSAATIQRLRQLGAKTVLLLTGDHHDRAAELAAQLGLDGYHAKLLPQDKARIIAELRDQGAHIAYVGDGINDAPALAGARVGIAMQKGADIARLTADLALLEDDVARVADAKAIANAAIGRIKSNYRLTVGLNTAILLAAAAGLLSPITTAVLHNGTTLGILLNALRPSSGMRRKNKKRRCVGSCLSRGGQKDSNFCAS